MKNLNDRTKTAAKFEGLVDPQMMETSSRQRSHETSAQKSKGRSRFGSSDEMRKRPVKKDEEEQSFEAKKASLVQRMNDRRTSEKTEEPFADVPMKVNTEK